MSLDKAALESLRLDRNSDPKHYQESGTGRRRWWIVAVVAVAIAALIGWRVLSSAVPVRTAVVEAPAGASDGAVLNASGYVVARRLATVSSKVTGRIDEVLFEEGATVQQGQVLARLDPSTTRAQYEVESRSLAAARSSLGEIEVRLQDARRTLARNRSLVESKLVSQSVLDASQAEVAALEAQSRLALAQQGVDDLAIRAPFSGVVISKDAQPGETVSPMSAGGGFTRTGIATIVDMESREIEVDVNEAYINRVRDGQTVAAVLDAYPEWTIPGHVISIVPTADRQKATVRVRIAFDQLDPRILPDMGIKVRFLEEPGNAAAGRPMIPANAVVREDATTVTWVVRDGKVEKRALELGEESAQRYPVLKGLEGGESVVVDPPRRLRDGAAVQLEGA